jgi:L-asparagine transporter-like permease
MLTPRLREKNDAKKANTIMLITLTIIYLFAVGFAVTLAPINTFTADESPFVLAMNRYGLGFFPHVFNGGIIIAGFSTMSASLFAVTNILVTLSEDGDAPSIFSKKGKKLKVAPFALLLTLGGLSASIIFGLLMPDRVYEFITTAASLMLLYNWMFVLFAYPKLIELTKWGRVKQWTGVLLIVAAVSGTLMDRTSRPGFLISLMFVGIIAIVLIFMQRHWKKKSKKRDYKWLRLA